MSLMKRLQESMDKKPIAKKIIPESYFLPFLSIRSIKVERRRVDQLWDKTVKKMRKDWFRSLESSNKKEFPSDEISQLYEVFKDQVLGNGQFGTICAGVHRYSRSEVAIKEIQNASVDTLKSEVAILQAIDHNGIIKVQGVFESLKRVFIVMDRMDGDMLKMIMDQPNRRLSERQTKFLVMQILTALRYLHARGIAHCDLKPDNVLVSNSDFPHAKLCDFGYAQFIEDGELKSSTAGTKSYLAPEVLKGEGYNKSMDMWSVGAIVYVAVSGTFPFDEDQEIAAQLENNDLMFPSDPWKKISDGTIDLILKLFKIQLDQRLKVDECIAHEWLQSVEVYKDLRSLEERLGGARFLTSEQDDVLFQVNKWKLENVTEHTDTKEIKRKSITSHSTQKNQKKRRQPGPVKPRYPRTFFLHHNRFRIATENPHFSSYEVVAQVMQEWRTLKDKSKWRELANKDRKRYLVEKAQGSVIRETRSPRAYDLWRLENSPRIANEYPNLNTKQTNELLGREWKQLKDKKTKWLRMAEEGMQVAAKKPKKAISKAVRPKQPSSAYWCWWSSNRLQFTIAHPGLSANQLTRIAAEEWRKVEDRSIWESKAAKDRKRYLREKYQFERKEKKEQRLQ